MSPPVDVDTPPTFRVLGTCLLILSLVGVALVFPASAEDRSAPPWEIWSNLNTLSVLHQGDQVLLRSSHDPDGGPYDRHSALDWRYIRLDGDEGVIFEEAGAGAISRIWMTQGYGVSQPLDPSIRIRFYLDGATAPTLDLPLSALFDGSTAPFEAPLVGDRLLSSGGNYSYVPIPYRDGCRVSLLGANDKMLWFQFTFHRLAEAGDVLTFTGQEDLSSWAELLGTRGEDPWTPQNGLPPTSEWIGGDVDLQPGEAIEVARLDGPDSITTLRLVLPEVRWEDLHLELNFDGTTRASMAVTDFFAVGRGGASSTRSLLLGVDTGGALYSYFPMPFSSSATLTLANHATSGPTVTVSWQLRRSHAPPPMGCGLFTARLRENPETTIGVDIPVLELEGRGRWVGLFADLGSVDTTSRAYLEGDERLFIDGSLHPAVYGTGTEDLFNGGFYFDQGEFQLALHGEPYHLSVTGEDITGMYRLMPVDGVTFTRGLRAGLEGGSVGDLSLRARTVAYLYHQDEPGLFRCDVLDLGDPKSRQDHGYVVDGVHEFRELDSFFEGKPPVALLGTGVYRPAGTAHFVLSVPADARRLRLRRRLDASIPWQVADVWVDGLLVSRFPPVDPNPYRPWREIDLDLPKTEPTPTDHDIQVSVIATTNPTGQPEDIDFTAFVWELWTDVEVPLFADGFESGQTTAWSYTTGSSERVGQVATAWPTQIRPQIRATTIRPVLVPRAR